MKAYIIYKHLYNFEFTQKMIGGIETYLENLARVFYNRGIKTSVIQIAKRDIKIEEDGIVYEGFMLPNSRKWHKKLYKKIQNRITDDDIIIWGTDTFSIRIKETRRTISIQHGIDFDYYPEEDKKRLWMLRCGLGHLLKFFQRKRAVSFFKKSTIKVCVDYNFWNWYRTYSIPSEERNIHIIPNFSYISEDREDKLDSRKVIKVLFARRFVRRRGVDVMLKVAEAFSKNNHFEFTFAGDGPDKHKIIELQEKQKNIIITSYKAKDTLSFHSQYDIAVIPTIGSEGTSFSLLEAMSAGCVVICSGVGGMTNIVLDKYNGYIVPPNSPSEIINTLLFLLDNPSEAKKVSQQAQNTIKKSFSIGVWQSRWNKVIDDIVQL